jgi:hypothetical protein
MSVGAVLEHAAQIGLEELVAQLDQRSLGARYDHNGDACSRRLRR